MFLLSFSCPADHLQYTVFSFAPQLSSCTLSFLNIEFKAFNLIGVLLFVGAVGKSAQLGLHTWLPDATLSIG